MLTCAGVMCLLWLLGVLVTYFDFKGSRWSMFSVRVSECGKLCLLLWLGHSCYRYRKKHHVIFCNCQLSRAIHRPVQHKPNVGTPRSILEDGKEKPTIDLMLGSPILVLGPLQLDCSSVRQWDVVITFAGEVRFEF